MPIFKLYLTPSNQYRWRLQTDERPAYIFADSGQEYTDRGPVLQSINMVRAFAAEAVLIDNTGDSPSDPPLCGAYFELYPEEIESIYRWRLNYKEAGISPGKLIAYSTGEFATREDALRDIQMVRDLAPEAGLRDQTDEAPPYNLGKLPPELTIQWPIPPEIIETVEINTAPEDGFMRVEQGRTRYIIAVNLERLILAASDIEVQLNEGVRIGKLIIEKALSRFHITGGLFGNIELSLPSNEEQLPEQELLIEDVLVSNVTVITVVLNDPTVDDNENNLSGLYLRGRRIAILNSRIQAYHYSVWLWANTDAFPSEDIILAGNVFESAGREATVRLVDVLRSVAVNNRFVNIGIRTSPDDIVLKHNYRVHGRSDLNFAARNTLLKGGIKLASEPPDFLGTVWFNNNLVYHHSNSPGGVLDVGVDGDPGPGTARLRQLNLINNIIFSERLELLREEVPEEWTFENNYFRYIPGPAALINDTGRIPADT